MLYFWLLWQHIVSIVTHISIFHLHKCDMLDKRNTDGLSDGRTFIKSYVWPVPLPDNKPDDWPIASVWKKWWWRILKMKQKSNILPQMYYSWTETKAIVPSPTKQIYVYRHGYHNVNGFKFPLLSLTFCISCISCLKLASNPWAHLRNMDSYLETLLLGRHIQWTACLAKGHNQWRNQSCISNILRGHPEISTFSTSQFYFTRGGGGSKKCRQSHNFCDMFIVDKNA